MSRVHDADHRYVGKIQPLGDHLRAKENVHFAARYTIENLGVRPFSARRIHVHPRDRSTRKAVGEKPLDLLGSKSAMSKRATAAATTDLAKLFLVPAVMTEQTVRRAVKRECDLQLGHETTCRIHCT